MKGLILDATPQENKHERDSPYWTRVTTSITAITLHKHEYSLSTDGADTTSVLDVLSSLTPMYMNQHTS